MVYYMNETNSTFTYIPTSTLQLRNPHVVMGFPDAGLVGSIATSHIIEKLKLEEAGYFDSVALPPMVVVHKHKLKSPIRVYARPDLVVLISEIPISFSMVYNLTEALVQWLKDIGSELTFLLGGLAHPQRLEIKLPKVYGICSKPELESIVKKKKIHLFEDGMIVGVNAYLLFHCFRNNLPVIYLLSESHFGYPDPSAAAAVLTALNSLTGLDIDVKALVEKGEEIRIKARELMLQTQKAMEEMEGVKKKETPMMYR